MTVLMASQCRKVSTSKIASRSAFQAVGIGLPGVGVQHGVQGFDVAPVGFVFVVFFLEAGADAVECACGQGNGRSVSLINIAIIVCQTPGRSRCHQ